MSIEAYQIGVSFVADATKVSGSIGEMLRGMDRILERQKDVNMGFVSMVSSLGGARRLAGGLASDLERAAKAARDIASASGRFRPASASSGAAAEGSNRASSARSSNRTSPAEMAAAATAAAQQTSARGQLLLPAPDLRLTYDPSANMRTSTAGIPGNGILGGAGIPVGSPYGPPPPSRPQRGLAIIPGIGVTEEGIEDEPFFEGNEPRESRWSKMRRGARTAVKAARTGSMTGLRTLGNMRVPHKHHALTLPEVFAGYLGWHVLSSGFEQAGDYDQTFLSMSGDPRANLARLRGQADWVRQNSAYINPVDSANIVAEGYDLSGGDMRESKGIAGLIARADTAFQLMGKNSQQALVDSKQFIRGQDISNRFFNKKTGQFDVAAANASTDSALGMIFANRLFMQGKNFFQFASSAGTAAQTMSDTGMFNLAHFIDINPRKAGMQVRSFENLFGGDHPRMEPKELNYFKSLGLIGKDGRFHEWQRVSTDPIGWITDHLDPLMPKHPELVGHIQRMNVGDLTNETYGAAGNIARGANAARRTNALEAMRALETGSKAAQLRTEVSWERFEFSLGQFAQGPGIKVLNSLTDALNNTSAYMAAHPNDMSRLATQAGDFAKGMVGAATLMSKAVAIVPSWLWPTLLGAAGGARVGGPWGAAAGATIGASYSLSHGALNFDHKYGYDNPNYHLTWKDKLDPFQLFHTPEKAQSGQPIQVNLQLGGQQVASVLVPHIEAKMTSNARKESRASNGMYDSWAGVTLPGVSGGR